MVLGGHGRGLHQPVVVSRRGGRGALRLGHGDLGAQPGRQPGGDAHAAQHMAATGDHQHGLAGLQLGLRHGGDAGVLGQLDARHGRELAGGQQIAVAAADGVALARPRGGRQVLVPVGLLHHLPHVAAAQVATMHGHPGLDGGHDHGRIGRPVPTGRLPVQGLLDLGFRGRGGQRPGAVPAVGHLQHHGRQALLPGQGLDRVAFPGLVFRGIVLFAQQQHLGQRGWGLQLELPARGVGGRCW
ncbi:Uncharacterised protein [Comamonas aquatica]|nr:Uncharacterised protein [Comamonas aquatica]